MALPRHWRDGETYVDWVKKAVFAPKVWDFLKELTPSPQYVDAFEAEVGFVTRSSELSARGELFLRGHQEESGSILVFLYMGSSVLRYGHVGDSHLEPDAGPLIEGPHMHYRTTKFPNIGSRRARSRASVWNISSSVTLREAIRIFARNVNIIGTPQEQQRLHGG